MIIVEEWIKTSRDERTAHLDLGSECLERGGNSTASRGVLAQYLNTNIPKARGIDLCHACHNDNCSNPKHLYWGTRSENIKDAIDNGTRFNPWDAAVAKYGLEEARKRFTRTPEQCAKAGSGNSGKAKSDQHKKNIAAGMKNKYC